MKFLFTKIISELDREIFATTNSMNKNDKKVNTISNSNYLSVLDMILLELSSKNITKETLEKLIKHIECLIVLPASDSTSIISSLFAKPKYLANYIQESKGKILSNITKLKTSGSVSKEQEVFLHNVHDILMNCLNVQLKLSWSFSAEFDKDTLVIPKTVNENSASLASSIKYAPQILQVNAANSNSTATLRLELSSEKSLSASSSSELIVNSNINTTMDNVKNDNLQEMVNMYYDLEMSQVKLDADEHYEDFKRDIGLEGMWRGMNNQQIKTTIKALCDQDIFDAEEKRLLTTWILHNGHQGMGSFLSQLFHANEFGTFKMRSYPQFSDTSLMPSKNVALDQSWKLGENKKLYYEVDLLNYIVKNIDGSKWLMQTLDKNEAIWLPENDCLDLYEKISSDTYALTQLKPLMRLKIKIELDFIEAKNLSADFVEKIKTGKNYNIVLISYDTKANIDLEKLKIISNTNKNIPILIKQGDQISIYGYVDSLDKWERVTLDSVPFQELDFQSKTSETMIIVNNETTPEAKVVAGNKIITPEMYKEISSKQVHLDDFMRQKLITLDNFKLVIPRVNVLDVVSYTDKLTIPSTMLAPSPLAQTSVATATQDNRASKF